MISEQGIAGFVLVNAILLVLTEFAIISKISSALENMLHQHHVQEFKHIDLIRLASLVERNLAGFNPVLATLVATNAVASEDLLEMSLRRVRLQSILCLIGGGIAMLMAPAASALFMEHALK